MNIRQTLAVTAGALIALTLAAATGARADTVLLYSFDPGTTFDFGGGNTYAAIGTFNYDVTTQQVTGVNYSAPQTGTGPVGPFVFTSAVTNSPTDVTFTNDCCGDQDEFIFAKSLALGGTDQIVGFNYLGTPESIVGSVTAVPEPAAWAMMLLGFFGIGFMVRGSNRKAAVAAA